MLSVLKKIYLDYLKTVGKKKFAFFLFSALFISGLTILEPLFFAKIISFLENFLKTGSFDQKNFFIILGTWGVFSIFYILISFLYRYYLTGLHSLKNFIRVFMENIGGIFTMSYGEYLSKKTGSIYKNFDRGTETSYSLPFFFFHDFSRSLFNIILILGVLLYIDIKMTLISLSLLPLMIFFGVYFNNKTIKKQKEINENRDKIYGMVGDFVNNFLLSKVLFLEKKFAVDLHEHLEKQYDNQAFVSRGWSILDVYTVSLITISRILVIGFGSYFVVIGELEFATLFLFYSYLNYIYFPLGFLFGSMQTIQRNVSEAETYEKEFGSMELEKLQEGEELTSVSGKLEFSQVNFGYSADKQILKGLSFCIEKGESVAFVGNTGAGKSTIINLILRLWDVDSGKILLDNRSITNYSKTSLRKHIGIVTQEVGLYNDTLRNNLLYANRQATDEEILVALKNAQAHFALDLEKGLDTIIGERGMKLSGGEKQRIAIARLFLKNPEILILDEATSALDNKTEKLVQTALDTLMQGKTSIIIAHRLSTIKNVDTIYMLENGQIVESGNYDELMKQGGKFSALANPDHLMIN